MNRHLRSQGTGFPSTVLFPVAALVAVVTLSLAAPCPAATSRMKAPSKPVRVIYDSDIGGDIDDTWALGLLKCPELDVKLVVGDFGAIDYRARIFAKFLEAAGRTDIPIGLGILSGPQHTGGQAAWLKGQKWKDLDGFREFLVTRLTGEGAAPRDP